MGASGKKVKGRYTFVYVYEDGEWKINHHHSSVMPEGIVTAEPITEKEVRSLFGLWNDALASKDPTKVADRYSKNGVLLPTVSDVPRTDYPGIVDYFTNFIKLQPQGEIESGNIIIGTNWAQDAGIYEASRAYSELTELILYLTLIVYDSHLSYQPFSYSHTITTQLNHLPISLPTVHHGRQRCKGQGTIHLRLRLRRWRMENLPAPQFRNA